MNALITSLSKETVTRARAESSSEKQFDIEVVTDPERFCALKLEWDALWSSQSAAGFYQSFHACLHAWQRIAEPGGHRLFCLVGWGEGKMLAVWPLTTYRKLVWRYVRPLDASGAEYAEVLTSDSLDAQSWIRAAWKVVTIRARADVVLLPYVRTGTSLNSVLALQKKGFTHRDIGVYAHLKSQGNWQTYYDSLSRGHRKDYRKSQRRLAELGTLQFEFVRSGDGRCPELVKWMISQKKSWAERAGKTGPWLFSDTYRNFLIRILQNPTTNPKLMIACLTLDGAPLAVSIIAVGMKMIEALIAGFDARYSKHSPGMTALEHQVKWAIEHELDYDFGNGGEQYKMFWSRNNVIATTTYHLPVSRWGLAALRLTEVRRQSRSAESTLEARQTDFEGQDEGRFDARSPHNTAP